MRAAPPTQAVACDAGIWKWVQLLLPALSAFVLAHWTGSRLWPDSWALAAASLGLAGAAAVWAKRSLCESPRHLQWDGAQWRLGLSSGWFQIGTLTLMLDLGGWVLVRCALPRPTGRAWGGSHWLALSARDSPAAWPELRVALHAWRAPQAATGAAPGPQAGA